VTSPRNYLLILLALTTLGSAALAWNQHLELIKLRAALQEKDLDAQLHQRDFETKIAALQASASKKAAKRADEASPNPSADQGPRDKFSNMRAMMNDPNFVKYMELQQKARLDSSFGPLFKQLNLSPAQLAAFQNLLVEKQSAARDVLIAARDQGLDPRTDRAEIAQLVAQSNAEVDSQIQSTLGPDGFAQYQNYEQTLPERNTVSRFQQSLSYTSAPLTDSQSQQLTQVLVTNAPKNGSNPTSLRALLGVSGSSPITDQDVADASGFLSPDQLAALKDQQATQKARADLAKSLFNPTPGSATPSAGATATNSAKPAGH
jgi:hypothetical protein